MSTFHDSCNLDMCYLETIAMLAKVWLFLYKVYCVMDKEEML
jgi:hypothetical protein